MVRRIGEGDIFDLNGALCVFDGNGVRIVRRFRLLIEHLEHAARGCDGVLEFCDHVRDIVERLAVLLDIGEEAGQLSDRQQRGADGRQEAEKAPGNDHAVVDQGVEKSCRRIGQGRVEGGFHAVLAEFPAALFEFFQGGRLVTEGLDDGQIPDHLVGQRRQVSSGFRLLFKEPEGTVGDEFCGKKCQRRQNGDDERDQWLQRQHEDNRSHDGYDTGEQVGESEQNSIGELLDICDDTADQIAGGMRVNVGERQAVNLVKGLLAQIPNDQVRDFVVDVIHGPLGSCRHYDADDDSADDAEQTREIDMSL